MSTLFILIQYTQRRFGTLKFQHAAHVRRHEPRLAVLFNHTDLLHAFDSPTFWIRGIFDFLTNLCGHACLSAFLFMESNSMRRALKLGAILLVFGLGACATNQTTENPHYFQMSRTVPLGARPSGTDRLENILTPPIASDAVVSSVDTTSFQPWYFKPCSACIYSRVSDEVQYTNSGTANNPMLNGHLTISSVPVGSGSADHPALPAKTMTQEFMLDKQQPAVKLNGPFGSAYQVELAQHGPN